MTTSTYQQNTNRDVYAVGFVEGDFDGHHTKEVCEREFVGKICGGCRVCGEYDNDYHV